GPSTSGAGETRSRSAAPDRRFAPEVASCGAALRSVRDPSGLLPLEPAAERRECGRGVAPRRAGRDPKNEPDPIEGQIGAVAQVEHGALALRKAVDRLPESVGVRRIGWVGPMFGGPRGEPL